jgi:3-hydroxybutyryl-CoA dehydrogenase
VKGSKTSTLYQHYLYTTVGFMNIRSICICGAGTMGSGIAQVAATADFHTILYDVNNDVLEESRSSVQKNLQTLFDKNKITEKEKDEAFKRIHFVSDQTQCVADLIIEAIVENMEAKTSLFNQLSNINGSKTIYATNTSSLSVSEIASRVSHPQRMAGMHFFNPAPLMKLVEVVRAEKTSDDVVETIVAVVNRMGKTPVVCKDSPGFIVNRVARPFYIESLRLIEEGQADFATIDHLLEASGFRMGPFKLMDLIGNDVNYAVSEGVYEQLNKPERLRPSYIQKQKVEDGELGKKTGCGYYQY